MTKIVIIGDKGIVELDTDEDNVRLEEGSSDDGE